MTKIVSEVHHHLGLREPRPGAVKIRLRDIVSASAIAAAASLPQTFGHVGLVQASNLGMLGNDRAGNCFWAAAAHDIEVATAEGGAPVLFTTAGVLSDYSAATGYDPRQTDPQGDNPTDQGTDMDQGAAYWRKTGIVDAKGRRHQIGAYVELTPGDLNEALYAAYWLGGVIHGIRFPAYAMDQFNAGEAWDVAHTNTKIEGGHAITGSARVLYKGVPAWGDVTYGKVQIVTDAFMRKYNDQTLAPLSLDVLSGKGLTPEGLSRAALIDKFNSVTKQ